MVTVAVSEPIPGVRQLLLNRPERRNALNLEMVTELSQLVAEAEHKVIIFGSSARAALSAGVDLSIGDAERAEASRALYSLYNIIRSSDAIVVAAATGHAVGGGAQLMLASDLRVASPDVSIQFAGPGHGLAVGAWGLPSLVGRGRAIELILTTRAVGADEALAIGLINAIHHEPLSWALEFARQVTSLPDGVASAVKRISTRSDPLKALLAERDHNDHWDGSMPQSGQVDIV
jgi:enoyl-CoA hydratase